MLPCCLFPHLLPVYLGLTHCLLFRTLFAPRLDSCSCFIVHRSKTLASPRNILCLVWVHIHPIMIKIPPVFFLNPYFKILFLRSSCSEIPVRMMSFCTGHSYDSWLIRPSYLRRVRCELSAIVSTPVQGKTRMSLINILRCFVVGCYSQHLSRWRGRGLMLLSL